MNKNFEVAKPTALNETEVYELTQNIDTYLQAHKNNRQEINRLTFQCATAIAESENSQVALNKKTGLRRIIGIFSGSNKKLQDKINNDTNTAIYAMQHTLLRMQEQNLLTLDLLTAVNEKLNAHVIRATTEINKTKEKLELFIEETKSKMISVDGRLDKLEKGVDMLNWQTHVKFKDIHGMELSELDNVSKIVYLVKDFYSITCGEWTTEDLLILRSAMDSVGILTKDTISVEIFLNEIWRKPEILDLLLDNKYINNMPDPQSLYIFSGIKKRDLLLKDESYLVDEYKRFQQDATDEEAESFLVKEYVAIEGDYDIAHKQEIFDFVLNLLYQIRQCNDEILLSDKPLNRIKSLIHELKNINEEFDISNNRLNNIENDISSAKVCTPIIGRFSSGKTALVNTFLAYPSSLLKEDILPETAFPAELIYSSDSDQIHILNNDGTDQQMTVTEFRRYVGDAESIRCVRLQLNNEFLSTIPDVMLVDMPGFESGFEVHNRAIDNYLPQSMAYIIAFPADDMTLRSSVGNILKELCLHNMPICIVITKCDKANTDEFEGALNHLMVSMRKYIGDETLRVCRTSSFNKDVEELKVFLNEVQADAQQLFFKKYSRILILEIDNTENYLTTSLNASELSESELAGQEEKLKQQLEQLNNKISIFSDKLTNDISEEIEGIKNDVLSALKGNEETYVVMSLNNQNITENINAAIRLQVTNSVNSRIIPKIERYAEKINSSINDVSVENIGTNFSSGLDIENITSGIVSTVLTMVSMLVFGPLTGIVSALAGLILGKLFGEKMRDENKQKIRAKLESEVFPRIVQEVGESVRKSLNEQIANINKNLQEDISNQKENIEKAIADVREKYAAEKTEKEEREKMIKEYLDRIGDIRNELR